MKYITVILLYAMLLGSGTFLVYTEHYWWAWIPFMGLFGVTLNEETPKPRTGVKDKT